MDTSDEQLITTEDLDRDPYAAPVELGEDPLPAPTGEHPALAPPEAVPELNAETDAPSTPSKRGSRRALKITAVAVTGLVLVGVPTAIALQARQRGDTWKHRAIAATDRGNDLDRELGALKVDLAGVRAERGTLQDRVTDLDAKLTKAQDELRISDRERTAARAAVQQGADALDASAACINATRHVIILMADYAKGRASLGDLDTAATDAVERCDEAETLADAFGTSYRDIGM